MKLIYLLIVLFLFSFSLNGQSHNEVDKIKEKLSLIEKQLILTNDSLKRELQFYKIKEDYYTLAVDRQGTHFETQISDYITFILFILGLISFVSWKFYYDDKKKFEERLKQNDFKIEQYGKDIYDKFRIQERDYLRDKIEDFINNSELIHFNGSSPDVGVDFSIKALALLPKMHELLRPEETSEMEIYASKILTLLQIHISSVMYKNDLMIRGNIYANRDNYIKVIHEITKILPLDHLELITMIISRINDIEREFKEFISSSAKIS